jgi:hypothetical protein
MVMYTNNSVEFYPVLFFYLCIYWIQSIYVNYGTVFNQQLEESSNSNFLQASGIEAPLFDVCGVVCDTPPETEESALGRALAYFEGVLGWRIAYVNHIPYLQARAAQLHYACMDQALYRTLLYELVLIS